ncbi:MAG: LptE family protein [Desulfobacterales bacterium]|nr:LptE family protein [Desulfobacterales bacterium]
MKPIFRYILVVFAVATLLTACGYRNPYYYSGPNRSIYVKTWPNRTNILLLDSKLYQSLIKWYQKAGSLNITKDKEGADYILAGEIVSINLPSLTYSGTNTTSEVNIRLKVRYILKDLKTEKVLIEVPSETWTEEYKVSANSSETRDNATEALEIIVDELSQKIYQNSLLEFSKL